MTDYWSPFANLHSFVSEETGWAVGRLGTILHTSNGGDSWSAQVSGVASTLTAVDAVSGAVWTVGDNGVVLRTTNGGGVWQRIAIGLTQVISIPLTQTTSLHAPFFTNTTF